MNAISPHGTPSLARPANGHFVTTVPILTTSNALPLTFLIARRFSSFQRVKAGNLLVQVDAAAYETQVAQAEVDEDVDGGYTKESNRARTSFL